VFALVGIRFESSILNYFIVAFLLSLPLYLFYAILIFVKANTPFQKLFKIISLTIVMVGVCLCTILLLFQLFAIAFIFMDGGVDQSKIEIDRINLSSNKAVVAYQTNGGATTDFGTAIYIEKKIFPGLKTATLIDSIYHTNDIVLELFEGKVVIKDITFTNPIYESEYYNEGGKIRDGVILEI
jgi:predicted membrane protein